MVALPMVLALTSCMVCACVQAFLSSITSDVYGNERFVPRNVLCAVVAIAHCASFSRLFRLAMWRQTDRQTDQS